MARWRRRGTALPAWIEHCDREAWRDESDAAYPVADYRAKSRWNDARNAWLRDHPAESRVYVERLIATLGTPVRGDDPGGQRGTLA